MQTLIKKIDEIQYPLLLMFILTMRVRDDNVYVYSDQF